jgi:hypothetical protein
VELEESTPVRIACGFEPIVDFDATGDWPFEVELGVADTVCSFGRVVDSDFAADGFPMGEDVLVPVPWRRSRSD